MAEIPATLIPETPAQTPLLSGGTTTAPPDTGKNGSGPTIAPTEPPPEKNRGSLSPLILIAMLILAIALSNLAKWWTDFLNWMLRSALSPFGGKTPIKPLDPNKVAQKLSNVLGNGVSSFDSQLGVEFTKLAEDTGRLASTLVAIGSTMVKLAGAISSLTHHTTNISAGQAAIRASVQKVNREAAQAQARISAAEKHASADTRAVHAQLTQLQQHVTHVIEPELETLRKQIPALHHGATVTWDEVKKHDQLLGLAAMTATVETVLRRNGGNWIECEANKLVGKALCRQGPRKLNNLINGLVDLAAILNICQLTTLLIDTAESGPVQDGLKLLTDGVDELVKCRGIAVYHPPGVRAPSLSPSLFPYAAVAPVS
jgi:hypothetical protein